MEAYTDTESEASWTSECGSLWKYVDVLIVYPRGKGKYMVWKLTGKAIASQYFTERDTVVMEVNSHENFSTSKGNSDTATGCEWR